MKRIIVTLLFCFLLSACSRIIVKQVPQETKLQPGAVRINVTFQGYQFRQPWQQRKPATRTAIGAVIAGPLVLTTAELLENHRYIEFETINSGEKCRAEVVVIDYNANLALLKPEQSEFLKNIVPLELSTTAVQGDQLAIWQVRPNGNLTPSYGVITAIEVGQYPYRESFLTFRMNNSLQYRFKNLSLPVLKDHKLAGLLMYHDAKAQTTDIVPAPVIAHFLKDAAKGHYQGFPLAGILMTPAEDPQLRNFVGLKEHQGGVYVESIIREKSLLQPGDIIMQVNGFDIDARGNYDDPLYGKVSVGHLIRCKFFNGDKIKLSIFRAKQLQDLEITVENRPAEDYTVPPYRLDVAPRYLILGGLVFQELSISYLEEYGSRWDFNAPIALVHYAYNQNSIDMGGRKKIVFMSMVLPSVYTIGYEQLNNLVVPRINKQLLTSLDDIPAALEHPINGFHKIEFEQRPGTIYMDASQIDSINQLITERYHIPIQNLN